MISGLNKHFQMAFICEKFGNNINKDVHPDKIWKHLGTMYNLKALEEYESFPFPNNKQEFALPDDEFGVLMSLKGENVDIASISLPNRNMKETPHRNVNGNTKDIKKDSEKPKSSVRNRSSNGNKGKIDDTPKIPKRPLRGSLKLEEGSSNGKASPTPIKRRRII